METITRQLNEVLPGRVIEAVEVRREKSFSGSADRLIGLSVVRVTRKAKNIIIETRDQRPETRKNSKTDNLVILIHLKMTGQLIFVEKVTRNQIPETRNTDKTGHWSLVTGGSRRIVGGHPTEDWINTLPSKHTRVIIRFEDGSTLYFNDMRVFGWVKVTTNNQLSIIKNKLPPDVVDPEFTVENLATVLKKSSRAVKLVLLDQSKIGGLGNIYVNDALYLSHTKPTRKANSLKLKEIIRLHEASVRVISRGIETGGASESTFKHINGMGGKYQEEFLIYKREGEVCGLDGCLGVIKKIKLGGRGTYFCPKCQK